MVQKRILKDLSGSAYRQNAILYKPYKYRAQITGQKRAVCGTKVVRKDRVVDKSGDKWKRPMFLGEYTHSVDVKGRVAIPVKFRPELAQGAVVTRGLDGCLFIYPQAEWQVLAEKL